MLGWALTRIRNLSLEVVLSKSSDKHESNLTLRVALSDVGPSGSNPSVQFAIGDFLINWVIPGKPPKKKIKSLLCSYKYHTDVQHEVPRCYYGISEVNRNMTLNLCFE